MRIPWWTAALALGLLLGVVPGAWAEEDDVEIVELEESAPAPEAPVVPEDEGAVAANAVAPEGTGPAEAASAGVPTPAPCAAPAAGAWGCCPSPCCTVTCPPVTQAVYVPVFEDVEVPLYETRRTPRYREIEVPVYGVRQVPVYGWRRIPRYEEATAPVCETKLIPVTRECCDPCTGCIVTAACGYRTETVRTGERTVRRLVGWDVERYECSTRPERYQTGTETRQVLCGYESEVVQCGTRTLRRLAGWRCETQVVCPARTVAVPRCGWGWGCR